LAQCVFYSGFFIMTRTPHSCEALCLMLKKKQMSEKRIERKKLKKEKISERIELDSDENFAFIVGYTSGGAPYGLSHEEMTELEKEENKTEIKTKFN
jgi:hypothetical protein